ncbi:MAG: c-type cytochrome domain-containing protein [Verrucomicrobiota bacterium]
MKITTSIKLAFAMAAIFGATLAYAADPAELPPASTRTGVTYATDIKPIFEASCVKCHSGEKPKAKLRLDTLENALKGSKDGKVITAGDSANSLMVKCVAHVTKDHDSWMPPAHNKANIGPLTPDQIGLIRAWIDQGAK